MEALLEEMRRDFENAVLKAYDGVEERIVAEDALPKAPKSSPVTRLARILGRIREKWMNRWVKFASRQAPKVIGQIHSRVTNARKSALKEMGLTVKLNPSRATTERIAAIVSENLQLMEAVPSRYLDRATATVMRCVSSGLDRARLTESLMKDYGYSFRDAAVISRDQTAKATQAISETTDRDLGITEGMWVHVPGRKESRPTHVRMHGKRFKFGEGLYDSDVKRNVTPGSEILCVTGESKFYGSAFIEKLFRHFYSGELAELVTDDGTVLTVTPNHPVLTRGGWKKAGLVDVGDYVVKVGGVGFNVTDGDKERGIPTFEELFDSFRRLGMPIQKSPGAFGQFHGDGSNGDVDVIDVDGFLRRMWDSESCQRLNKLLLAGANVDERLATFPLDGGGDLGTPFVATTTPCVVSGDSVGLSDFRGDSSRPDLLGLLYRPGGYPGFDNALPYSASGDFKVLGNLIFGYSRLVHGDNLVDGDFSFLPAWMPDANGDSTGLDMFREAVLADSNLNGNILEERPAGYSFSRIVDNRRRYFSGHVYNLQTKNSCYIAQKIIVHNCMCTYRPVIPEEWMV